MSKSLWDVLMAASSMTVTKSEFGRIMHDPNATEEEKDMALAALADAEGYENLPEDY